MGSFDRNAVCADVAISLCPAAIHDHNHNHIRQSRCAAVAEHDHDPDAAGWAVAEHDRPESGCAAIRQRQQHEHVAGSVADYDYREKPE